MILLTQYYLCEIDNYLHLSQNVLFVLLYDGYSNSMTLKNIYFSLKTVQEQTYLTG